MKVYKIKKLNNFADNLATIDFPGIGKVTLRIIGREALYKDGEDNFLAIRFCINELNSYEENRNCLSCYTNKEDCGIESYVKFSGVVEKIYSPYFGVDPYFKDLAGRTVCVDIDGRKIEIDGFLGSELPKAGTKISGTALVTGMFIKANNIKPGDYVSEIV